MKALITSAILLMIGSLQVHAQGLITVQNGGALAFYTQLEEAVTNAQEGDTIYLPAGSFSLSQEINKELHIVGVGYHPDSTAATGRTIFLNRLTIGSGADNGSITGIYFSTGILYGAGQISFVSDVIEYNIWRCYIQGGVSNTGGNVTNVVVRENIIGSYSLCLTCSNYYSISFSSPNNSINNNVILSKVGVNGSVIKNNIFLFYNPSAYSRYPLYSNNCVVENNVFTNASGSTNSIFRNNINCSISGVDGQGNQGVNNFCCDELSNIFAGYGSTGGFQFSDSFHLPQDSPYLNAGTDGTDIGIYGGVFPWKDGGIPFNPRIVFKNNADATDQDGNLLINIKVEAQGN